MEAGRPLAQLADLQSQTSVPVRALHQLPTTRHDGSCTLILRSRTGSPRRLRSDPYRRRGRTTATAAKTDRPRLPATEPDQESQGGAPRAEVGGAPPVLLIGGFDASSNPIGRRSTRAKHLRQSRRRPRGDDSRGPRTRPVVASGRPALGIRRRKPRLVPRRGQAHLPALNDPSAGTTGRLPPHPVTAAQATSAPTPIDRTRLVRIIRYQHYVPRSRASPIAVTVAQTRRVRDPLPRWARTSRLVLPARSRSLTRWFGAC